MSPYVEIASWVIHSSPVFFFQSATTFSCPFPPKLAIVTISPSSRLLSMIFRSSGAASGLPFDTTGMRPLPMPISFIFSRMILVSGTLVVSTSRTSGRALRTFCTIDVASDSGGV